MSASSSSVHLVWIYDGHLANALDAATWLNTTAELRRSGWRVKLIAAGNPGLREIRGLEVLCVWQPHVYLLRHVVFHLGALGVIARLFNTIDAILFHEASAPWMLPVRVWRGFLSRRRPLLVMDSRSLPMPPAHRQSARVELRRMAQSLTTDLGNRIADGRLAITQRLADAVHIPPEKLWGTWPSGADPLAFTQDGSERQWPTPDEPVRLIYHGALHHERNLMALCQAVVSANKQGTNFELVLLGQGSQESELRDFARGTSGAVQLLNPIPYEKVPQMLAHIHVGVLPFPDEEKFRVSSPIKLFEYMASGMPILVTRIVCHTDVVGSGPYAFWAEDSTEQGLLAALKIIWGSRQNLQDMGQEAARASGSWSWSTSAEKLKRALEIGLAQ
jgi:glycosyltransferase involved in cell wall biosynthesis